MKIQNTELGVIYKNLKDLCNVLDLEYKDSTNSRKSILKYIEQYMELERQGNKYIVKKVYDEPIQKADSRGKSKGSRSNNSVYVKYIDVLVKGILSKCFEDRNIIYTSNTAILKNINLAENTFTEELSKVDKDSYINIKLKLLSTLNNMLTSSLKRLERQSYINLKEGYVILEDNTARLANRKETIIINAIRGQLLKELNIKPIQLLLNKSIRYKFYTKLKERLVEQTDHLEALEFVYRGYLIRRNTKPLTCPTKAETEVNIQQLIDLINQRIFNDYRE